jgi:uracil-DNA glycosylase
MTAVYGVPAPVPRPKFGHGAQVSVPGAPDLLGCFHVSQQNTFTGKLTPAMLDDVLARAKRRAGLA